MVARTRLIVATHVHCVLLTMHKHINGKRLPCYEIFWQ